MCWAVLHVGSMLSRVPRPSQDRSDEDVGLPFRLRALAYKSRSSRLAFKPGSVMPAFLAPLYPLPRPLLSQKTDRARLQLRACQPIQWEGNIKHSRCCLLELGKLRTPQFTLLSETPVLATEQNPRGRGLPPAGPAPRSAAATHQKRPALPAEAPLSPSASLSSPAYLLHLFFSVLAFS